MKYLLILLFVCVSLASNAQGNPGKSMNEPNFYVNGDQDTRMAGEYLQKYSRQFYLGTGLMAGGYAISLASIYSESAGLITVGGLAILGGFVVQVLSHRHIGKAGELLERSAIAGRVQIQGSPAGLGMGLAYRF